MQCVLSAAACVVIGWQPSFPLASIWGAGRASRLGRARLSRGCGRRYLRRSLSLTEKQLPSRRNMELHGSKAICTCVRDWRFFGSEETNILSLGCHSPTFNTSTSSVFCVPRLDEGTKARTVVMIELKHAEDYGLAEPYTTTRNPARFFKYLIMEVVNGGRMTECHLICSEGFSFQTEAQWIRCM